MAIASLKLFSSLQNRLLRLDRTRRKVEILADRRLITRFDVEQIYVGLYVDAFVSFERFIEDLFFGYLTGTVTPPNGLSAPKLRIPNKQLTIDVVQNGKKYLDWIPFHFTKDRANIYFKKGHPFTGLDKNDEKTLEALHRIRNAVAHRSDHAVNIFVTHVISSLPLMAREKKPAGFLRSTFRSFPHQTRFENYLIELLSIGQKLSTL